MSYLDTTKMPPLAHELYDPQRFQIDFKERLKFDENYNGISYTQTSKDGYYYWADDCSDCDTSKKDTKPIQNILQKMKKEGFKLDTSPHTIFVLVFIILISLFIYSNSKN